MPRPVIRYRERRDLDRTAVRYFVYFLLDIDEEPVYIGRSCNVANRIRAHHATLTHPGQRPAMWLLECRTVTMLGPFDWEDACAVERAQIERHQPRGNIQYTARDHRPAAARRSRQSA